MSLESWVYCVTVKGALLPVSEGPVRFGAKHLRHSTCEFSGQRLVVVAYSLQAMQNASASDINRLRSLGFQVPEPSEQPLPSVPIVLRSTGAPKQASVL